ncbi:3-phenylpropionic acid transporter [Bacillus coahuilensis m2-6]|uniref:3-phenylpropionic acid transporter n=2 Tax=Bacillus coahuilensis TaxID=408580 RepID=A0A147K4N5_9BACI|nr:MFS transporter [Bacillus coahuilensis]KUP04394.1 3-phenylpropionic acid transporter [Bacillus coahuilensis p1.1.43]KUP05465.1 3-phenylpropionic acid transporter [Bacillus coahuilensis m2-6]
MNTQTWLSFRFFAIFFTWGIFVPFWTSWLVTNKGLSVTTVSTIMAVGMMARALSSFLVFPKLSQKWTLSSILNGVTLSSVLALLLFIPFQNVGLLILFMVLLNLIYPLLLPLVESMGAMMAKDEGISYGASRAWGSLGYTAALLVVGWVISLWNEDAIFYLILVGLVGILFMGIQKSPASIKAPRKQERLSFRELLQSKRFIYGLLAVVIIQGSHAAYYNYGVLYLKDLNVSSGSIGLFLNVAVIAEIIFFRYADKIVGNVSSSWTIGAAGLLAMVRWGLLFLFPSTAIFLGSQFLHAGSFALAHFGFMRLMYSELKSDLVPSAQGVYTSLIGLLTAVCTFAGGLLYDIAPTFAFLGMVLFVIPSLYLSFVVLAKYEKAPIFSKEQL